MFGRSGSESKRTSIAISRAIAANASLPGLVASVTNEVARDKKNALLRQSLAELHGALGEFDNAKALHVEARARASELKRKLTTPKFTKAQTPTVLCAISNICNINCRICETQNSTVPKGNMDRELVMNVIDQCKARGIQTIILHHVNEPLLHPAIFEILNYLEDNGMAAIISTNANEMKSVLNRAAKQNRLPSALNLRYSIDAGRPETYNEIRRGGDFETVMAGLASMREFCADRGIALQTATNYVMTGKSIFELSDFADRVGPFVPLDRMQFSFVNGNTPTGLNQYIIDNRVSNFVRRTPCDAPYQLFNILKDGRVSLCCMDFNEEAIVGDIRKQSIDAIWNGAEIERHRLALTNQDVPALSPICRRCYFSEAAYVDPNPAIQHMFRLKQAGLAVSNEAIVNRIRFELMMHGIDLSFSNQPLHLHETSDDFVKTVRAL